MTKTIPDWALTSAGPEDYAATREAHDRGVMIVTWPDLKALRDWAVLHGWPRPRFGIKEAFMARMLDNEANFQLALRDSGIQVQIPAREVTISPTWLDELDALYDQRSDSGRPNAWGPLVEDLRAIRRAVEAGVVVHVDGGPTLRSWQDFYTWAHGRYHMLEDGYDHWIGDDAS